MESPGDIRLKTPFGITNMATFPGPIDSRVDAVRRLSIA